jgi:2-iminobutanoate/2-iminopropanoate deaminase
MEIQWKVERADYIAAVGLVREASPKRHKETTMQHITLPSAKALHLPFCSAVRAGDFLFLSGAIGNRPGTMNLAEGGLQAQARQAMDNIGEVLGACGLGFADTVKFTIMLADMRRWAEFNAVYLGYFDPERLPARSAFGASGLALGGEVEIECIAYWPGA